MRKKVRFSDLIRFLEKTGEDFGHDEDRMVRICLVGMVRYFETVDRWIRLENDRPGKVAPLWLSETDADALLKGLRGQKGAEIRLIRQELQGLHKGAAG